MSESHDENSKADKLAVNVSSFRPDTQSDDDVVYISTETTMDYLKGN